MDCRNRLLPRQAQSEALAVAVKGRCCSQGAGHAEPLLHLLRSGPPVQKARPAWRRSITRIEEPGTTTAFKAKMETEEARQIYAQRSQIAEFAPAWIKERCGLRQFRCRGRLKATMEATWACLSYNLARWFSIERKRNALAATALA